MSAIDISSTQNESGQNGLIARGKHRLLKIETEIDNDTIETSRIKSINSSNQNQINSHQKPNHFWNHNSNLPVGQTSTGEKFRVPLTHSTLSTFDPRNFSLASTLSLSLITINLIAILSGKTSKWPHIVYFLFWRCCYDIGLGIILTAQSKRRAFSEWYKHTMQSLPSNSITVRILNHLAKSQLVDKTLSLSSLPEDFKAWLVYKNFVNVILVNDGINYLLLGLKCFNMPTEFSLLLVTQYALGIALGVFNWWAKVDAHRCIGEYCWYWGDFFYTKHQTLTFDGIFELFPHPMYTVGYSLYYGYSLILRSYTMLYISLVAHAMQMLFLILVEEPHIEKLYGGKKDEDSENNKNKNKAGVFFFNLRIPYNPVDCLMLCCSFYIAAMTYFSLPKSQWLIWNVVLWRCIHWVGLGAILWNQSKREWWTRRCAEQFYAVNKQQAFEIWKSLYNASLTINVVAFTCCCLKHVNYSSFADILTPFNLTCITIGFVCLLICAWSCWCTYEAIGEFGYFYGDFFLTKPQSGPRQLCYTGIYRFLNNPDCVTGHFGCYGAALMCHSYTIFALALLGNFMNIVFLNVVEIPHMEMLYSREKMRIEPPMNKMLKKVTHKMIPNGELEKVDFLVRQQAREIKMKALREVFALYKKMRKQQHDSGELFQTSGYDTPFTNSGTNSPASNKRRLSDIRQLQLPTSDITSNTPSPHGQYSSFANSEVIRVSCPEEASIHRPLVVHYQTTSNHSDTDWIGLYEASTPSMPAASEGRWLYVNSNGKNEGDVIFPVELLPKQPGVFEVRYHRANRYTIRATQLVLLKDDTMSPRNQQSNSSTPNSATQSEEKLQNDYKLEN